MSKSDTSNASATEAITEDDENTVHYSDTLIPLKKLAYTWRIHNFSFLHAWRNAQDLKSAEFPAGKSEKIKWHLYMHPMGAAGAEEYVSCFLSLVTRGITVPAKFGISIINDKKEKVHTMRSELQNFETGKCTDCGWKKFISRDFLRAEKKGILKNDILTIFCEITIGGDIANVPGTLKVKVPDSSLRENFSLLFEKKEWSDVTIVIDGHTEFSAHKAILAARSPVFAAMFKDDSKEEKQNRINISDMDQDVLREMLLYIYTDNVTNIEKIAADLLMAADRYALERLKIICEKVLCTSLEIENSAALLTVASLCYAKYLKAEAKNFICLHMKAVMKTEGYKLMSQSHPDLLNELMQESVVKNNN